jgi:hypothetical protein
MQPLSAPLQGGLRFFQYPLPATPTAFLADAPAPALRSGRGVGFIQLGINDTGELVPACTPAVWIVRVLHASEGATDCIADFGQSLSAPLARRV